MTNNQNKIAFITIYFGNIPDYLNLFLDSASKNPSYDFIVFSDWGNLPDYGDNIFFIKISLEEFNQKAISKGILRNPIKNTYKLCDLKPAWIHILDDIELLNKYEFIGYVDIDMIFGRIDHFIDYNRLSNLDLWSISNVLISGAFTIYKNSEKMKMLYRKADCWQQVFDYPESLAFDETLHTCTMKSLNGVELISFTDLVYKEKDNGLKIFQEDNIIYEWYYKTIKYKNGVLTDLDGKEYISYHYVKVKKHLLWYYPKWKHLPNSFYINRYGYSNKFLGPLNILKIVLTPPYFYNAIAKIKPYIPRLFHHILHTKMQSVITTIKDKL